MTKKMYTSKPIVENEPTVQLAHPQDRDHERITQLERKVTQLSEQVNRLVEALDATRRGLRRQGSDINTLTTVIRSR